MAVEQANVVIGSSIVLLSTTTVAPNGNEIAPHTVTVQMPSDAAGAVLVGTSEVADDAYGFRLMAGQTISIDLGRNERLYAVAEDAEVAVSVLRTSV